MEIISSVLAGLVIREGFGKLSPKAEFIFLKFALQQDGKTGLQVDLADQYITAWPLAVRGKSDQLGLAR
jgi:hypothetical protein